MVLRLVLLSQRCCSINAQMLSWRGLLRDYSHSPFGGGIVFRTARDKKTFGIDQATLREIDGVGDSIGWEKFYFISRAYMTFLSGG